MVFVFAIAYILTSIESQKNLISLIAKDFSTTIIPYFILIFLLQFVNWTLEALKFYFLLPDSKNLSFNQVLKSVYVGNLTAIVTPKRLGNFIGRNWILKDKAQQVTISTISGNFYQLFITIIMAFCSFLYLYFFKTQFLLELKYYFLLLVFFYLLLLFLIGYTIFNNNWHPIVNKLKLVKYFNISTDHLNSISSFKRIKVLFFAMSRYWIFIFQYYLLLKGFNITVDFLDVIILVGLLFGTVTFLPSFAPGNLGTREALSIFILGGSALGIKFALVSFLVWSVNVAFSALIGAGLLFTSKTIKW
ncbi:MAG: flippase-like domain-containing protein [Flavobacteriales bacterium]|nr:flippase-like domain-containing protein [Flavobacteriales bacterium]MBL6869515.1 flippase-like domain-containing protein [Flavobacteriales bacterium]